MVVCVRVAFLCSCFAIVIAVFVILLFLLNRASEAERGRSILLALFCKDFGGHSTHLLCFVMTLLDILLCAP